ncbi:dynein regulatory complex subunit 4-like [Parasteatoda tepidariorum]|uniref:dynein regulatory complex subunit 4-like n=1 Tax=Parasteatoda tepidariorum TaxID=114398 RepID=UPI00077FDB94|nr:putative WEB family protein At1g65010, chloroplastic [Parasteatoda tepidariorum]
MPPKKKDKKKKKEEDEEVGYDVNTMTTDELKKYARMLEKGIEEMRKHCSFYRSSGDKLAQFYQLRQQDLLEMENELLCKDIEMEDLQLKVQQEINDKEQGLNYREFSSIQHEKMVNSDTETKIAHLAQRHQKELNRLKEEFIESEKVLEVNSRRVHLAKRAAMYSAAEKIQDLEEHQEKLIEKNTEAFTKMLEDTTFDLKFNIELIETEALETKRIAEHKFRNSCLSYKEQLHEYYKNITKEDLAVIKELKQKIHELEESIKKSKSKLKYIISENRDLETNSERKSGRGTKKLDSAKVIGNDIVISKDFYRQRKIEKLRKENEVLEKEIDRVEKETDNLRCQFTDSLRKIRDSAERKAKLLENKIDVLFDYTN